MLLMLFLLSYRLLLSTIVVVRVVLVFTCVDVVAVSCCADNGFNVIFHGVLVSVVFVVCCCCCCCCYCCCCCCCRESVENLILSIVIVDI